jgi:hypothetical protein
VGPRPLPLTRPNPACRPARSSCWSKTEPRRNGGSSSNRGVRRGHRSGRYFAIQCWTHPGVVMSRTNSHQANPNLPGRRKVIRESPVGATFDRARSCLCASKGWAQLRSTRPSGTSGERLQGAQGRRVEAQATAVNGLLLPHRPLGRVQPSLLLLRDISWMRTATPSLALAEAQKPTGSPTTQPGRRC